MALVITIIVLLILAGVTINLTLGENGLLRRAQESKNAHEQGTKNDIEFMNNVYNYMEQYFNKSQEENTPIYNGKLTEQEREALQNNNIKELQGNEITNENLKDNDNIKGVITGEVPIPEGGEYKEGTKETGVVVAMGESEFVWVPVPKISEMARLQNGSTENYQGILYKFEGTTAEEMTDYGIGTTNVREPDIITSGDAYDADIENLNIINEILGTNYEKATDLNNELQTDYNKIVKSIEKYKGFYIGRYETSIDLASQKSYSKAGVLPTGSEIDAGNMWYGLYAYQKKMAKLNGYTSVESYMICGSTYDAMLRWALTGADAQKITTNGNALHNLTEVYETGKITVEGKVDRINNIYDLEGNGYEWTTEAALTYTRECRGGTYAFDQTVSNRAGSYPTNQGTFRCSRLMLYLI